jgi:hypothetical protein
VAAGSGRLGDCAVRAVGGGGRAAGVTVSRPGVLDHWKSGSGLTVCVRIMGQLEEVEI